MESLLLHRWQDENEEDTVIMPLKDIHYEVLEFINDFYETDKEYFDLEMEKGGWEGIYLRGNCYFFAKEVAKAFSNSQVWFNDTLSHAVAEVDGVLFDARGIVPYSYDDDFFEDNPFLTMLGNCWSYDWDAHSAGKKMYFVNLKEVLQTPAYSYLGYLEDQELEEWGMSMTQQFIYDYMTDDIELVRVAVENGWIDQDAAEWLLDNNENI